MSPQIHRFPLAFALGALLAAGLNAQVTAGALFAVVKMRTTLGMCSGFRLALPPKLYLVTARHCVPTGPGERRFEIWKDEKWVQSQGSFIFPGNAEVDIAAVELTDKILGDRGLPWGGGVQIGGPVYFLGYPSNLATRGKVPAPAGFGEIPFVKAGVLSAIDARQEDRMVHYIDGHNNSGFSGGPIVHRSAESGQYRVFAVVSGYRAETAAVLKSRDLQRPDAKAYEDLFVRSNSGIVVGYSVKHIVDAINAQSKVP